MITSSELVSRFRAYAKDEALPYFWSDAELFDYVGTSYRDFVRMMGGISDGLSPATRVPVLAGEAYGRLHPAVLRVLSAVHEETRRPLKIVHLPELARRRTDDYGTHLPAALDDRRGEIYLGVLGVQRGAMRWIYIPEEDGLVRLVVRRLPLDTIDGPDQCLHEVEDEYRLALLDGMFSLALLKRDAEVFDLGTASDFAVRFAAWGERARAALERAEYKPLATAYGGL